MNITSCETSGKKLVIGLDEAGYGPSLGPLVVGGTAWLVPQDFTEPDFSNAFASSFSTSGWSLGCQQIPLGDSKKLYQSGSGISTLEIGFLALLGMIHPNIRDVAQLLNQIDVSRVKGPESMDSGLPWYEGLNNLRVPVSGTPCSTENIAELSLQGMRSLASHQVKLVAIQSLVVREPDFNNQVRRLGSKGSLLSEATLALASSLLEVAPGAPADIFCDRQGGRKNYLPNLLHWMPDRWFVELQQTANRCSYRTEAPPAINIHFSVGGDSFPATALASMTAKYLRERLMESFNAFWLSHCPGLKSTAGYPEDAKRFRKEIVSSAHQLLLSEDMWWRCR